MTSSTTSAPSPSTPTPTESQKRQYGTFTANGNGNGSAHSNGNAKSNGHSTTSSKDTGADVCPVTGLRGSAKDAHPHDWRAPNSANGDIRSVCPALNTMANHGYIPRNGRALTALTVSNGLMKCYGLSRPLALFLSFGGFILIHKYPFIFPRLVLSRKFSWLPLPLPSLQFLRRISLHDLNLHNGVEHDASLVHADAMGAKYASIRVDPELVDELMADVRDHWTGDGKGQLMDATDVARARVRREKDSPKLDGVHAEIARGEMAIILGVWEVTSKSGEDRGVPVEWARRWFEEERLPEGWEPSHVQGLKDVVARSKRIRLAMKEMRGETGKEVKKPGLWQKIKWKFPRYFS